MTSKPQRGLQPWRRRSKGYIQAMDAAPQTPDSLMLFDGHCHLCSASVRAVLAIDRGGAIRFAPMQSAFGRELSARFGLNPDDPSSFIFFECGRPLARSDAMIAMARRFPWPWRALAAFVVLPRAVRNPLYDLVARNRYRLLGRREVCFLATPEQRERFLG